MFFLLFYESTPIPMRASVTSFLYYRQYFRIWIRSFFEPQLLLENKNIPFYNYSCDIQSVCIRTSVRVERRPSTSLLQQFTCRSLTSSKNIILIRLNYEPCLMRLLTPLSYPSADNPDMLYLGLRAFLSSGKVSSIMHLFLLQALPRNYLSSSRGYR